MSLTTPITPIPPSSRWPYLAVAAFVALIHVIWVVAGDGSVLDGNLDGVDGYMRLVRVTALYDSGIWFDQVVARANAPYGMVLVWTRLLDILLIALALPLVPVLGFKAALFWSGAVVSPLLHILTALALAWAVMPILRRADAFVAGALTATQVGFMGYAVAGHADHHILFALITALTLGFVIRVLTSDEYRQSHGVAIGGLLAVDIWIGPEAFVFVALCLTIAALPWIRGEDGWTKRNLHIAFGLTIGLALVVLIERGPAAYAQVAYERVSVVHLVLAALVWAFWGGIHATADIWNRSGPILRFTAAGAGGASTLGILWLLFPKILLGPLADADPLFLTMIGQISEFKPIGDVSHFLVFAGSTVFTVPWVLWRVREKWRINPPWPWILLICGLFVYLALTLGWIRAAIYLGIFNAIILSDLIGLVDDALTAHTRGTVRILAKVSVILFLAAGPTAIGITNIMAREDLKRQSTDTGPICDLRQLTRHLNEPPRDDRPRTILTSVNFGPEILYRTEHKVIGTLHSLTAAGVLDGIRILGFGDEAESLRLVRRRGIDLIVLCPGSRHDGYLTPNGIQGTLYERLVSGDPPAWIRPLAAPKGLAGFRLFRILTVAE